MKRTLSSRLTFFWKVIFPALWAGAIIVVAWRSQTHAARSDVKPIPLAAKWMLRVARLVGTLFMLWLVIPLKRVQCDDEFLYISNYQSEEAIPLSNIRTLRENRWA